MTASTKLRIIHQTARRVNRLPAIAVITQGEPRGSSAVRNVGPARRRCSRVLERPDADGDISAIANEFVSRSIANVTWIDLTTLWFRFRLSPRCLLTFPCPR